MSYYPYLDRFFGKKQSLEEMLQDPNFRQMFGDLDELPKCDFCEKEHAVVRIYFQYYRKWVCQKCLDKRTKECVNCPTLTKNHEKKLSDIWDSKEINVSIHNQPKNFCILYPASKCHFNLEANFCANKAKNTCVWYDKGICIYLKDCPAKGTLIKGTKVCTNRLFPDAIKLKNIKLKK